LHAAPIVNDTPRQLGSRAIVEHHLVIGMHVPAMVVMPDPLDAVQTRVPPSASRFDPVARLSITVAHYKVRDISIIIIAMVFVMFGADRRRGHHRRQSDAGSYRCGFLAVIVFMFVVTTMAIMIAVAMAIAAMMATAMAVVIVMPTDSQHLRTARVHLAPTEVRGAARRLRLSRASGRR
jgi:hypothetical protein